MDSIVEVKGLVKVYPGDVRAVDEIEFTVTAGEVFGFLGPNGAGKTTTIRMIVALLHRTSGEVRVAGFDPQVDGDEVRRRIGYAAQAAALDDDLTGRENLVLMGRLQGMAPKRARARADELIELFDLVEAADRRSGTYSGGMRKRLDLAGALVHRPQLLVLDEPTTGLDPQNRQALWSYLQDLRREGSTIFLTTQYMEEADRLAERIAIIDHGRLVAQGSPSELKSEIGADVISIDMPEAGRSPEALERIESLLSDLPGLSETRHDERSVAVFVKNGAQAVPEVVRRLDREGIQMLGLSLSTPSLDDVFLRHTGTRMRAEEVKAPSRTMMSRRRRR